MSTNPTTPPAEQRAVLAPGVIGRLTELGQVLVPGIYAWAVTVVPSTSGRTAPGYAWVPAFLAFGSLVAGCFLLRDRPRLGRALGIWAFLAFALVTWTLNPAVLRPDRIDPIRAASGAFGWMLYALGWGTPWRPGVHPEDDPRAELYPKLEPRKDPVLSMPLAVAIATIGSVLAMVLAWRATDNSRALMLHGLALAVSVALVSTASRVALAQGNKRSWPAPRQRLLHAFPWLMALVTVSMMLLAWWLSR